MDTIRLHDKTFRRSISCEQLQKAIAEVAARINSDYREKRTPLFVGVLNGSFMFMGELLRHISFDCEVSFVKIASYSGTATETIMYQHFPFSYQNTLGSRKSFRPSNGVNTKIVIL